MALSDTSKINISIKKLSGKAQTSNDKDLANEGLPTGVTLSSETIFGDPIPTAPSKSSLYDITGGVVEYLRLSASFIPGTDTSSGRHAFALRLPDDYESSSSNSKRGTYPFINQQVVYITSGALQLVPTSFATSYEATPYHSASNSQTQIPVLDARDWNLDYFNGIFFQQDPPATGDSDQNPRYVDAFLYIGSSVRDISENNAGGDPNAHYLVLSATGSLPNERVFTPGLGISGSDGGAGLSYTLSIRDSIVATLTGSQFSGNVGITGSFGATSTSIFGDGSSLSGLDNHFFVSGAINSRGTSTRGTAVFGGDVVLSGTLSVNRAQAGVGSFVTITSDGKVGIGSDTPAYKLSVGGNMDVGEYIYHKNDANTYIRFQNDDIDIQVGGRSMIKMREEASIDQVLIMSGGAGTSINPKNFLDTSFFVSGAIGSRGSSTVGTSVFGGDLLSSGTFFAPNGLSGSLTRLPDGSSYLISGPGINISSASNGSITLSLGSSERLKSDRILASGITSGNDVDVSSDFNSAEFSFNKIDIFVNGQLMISGSSGDYLLNTSKTGSIHFQFDLIKDDIITSIVNK